jgi:hypothetical protein
VSQKPRLALYAGLAILGLVSAFFAKIALFVLVGSFLAFLSVKPSAARRVLETSGDVRLLTALTAFAGVTSAVGFARFLVIEAMPGIVQGGTIASGAAAVSRLREILFAEDVMRQKAFIDPDGDRVGSAGFLSELLGRSGLRGRERLVPPVLERYPVLVETALGPAAEIAGYYFLVCLPAAGGGFTARPGEAVDDEAAERRFVAYAWPSQEGRGLLESYFIDEHERILFAHASAPAGRRERLGPERPPACDDALAPASRERWQVWRGKRPRTSLPGDAP